MIDHAYNGLIAILVVIALGLIGNIVFNRYFAEQHCGHVIVVGVCNRYGCRVEIDSHPTPVTTNTLVMVGDFVCRPGTRPKYRLGL